MKRATFLYALVGTVFCGLLLKDMWHHVIPCLRRNVKQSGENGDQINDVTKDFVRNSGVDEGQNRGKTQAGYGIRHVAPEHLLGKGKTADGLAGQWKVGPSKQKKNTQLHPDQTKAKSNQVASRSNENGKDGKGKIGGTKNGEAKAGNGSATPCIKQIQLWTRKQYWNHGSVHECPGLPCGYRQMEDKTYKTFDESDAVLFHYVCVWDWEEIIRRKPRGQKWIFYSLESPSNSFLAPLVPPRKYYNRTLYDYFMVYRQHKRNIRGGFGYFDTSFPYYDGDGPRNWAEGKDKVVAWVAKNCNESRKMLHWKRTQFVWSLSKKVRVDMYGKCGDQECERYTEDCNNKLRRHKFYLALENCNCREYITEKVWHNSFDFELVPIVYGPPKSDYERILPPNSFIHIGDFKTLQDLADYLLLLDSDDALYSRYHEWRSYGRTVFTSEPVLMQPKSLCKVVENILEDEKAVAAGTYKPTPPPDWDSWWLGSCAPDIDFPVEMK